jgi:hypothetical protein
MIQISWQVGRIQFGCKCKLLAGEQIRYVFASIDYSIDHLDQLVEKERQLKRAICLSNHVLNDYTITNRTYMIITYDVLYALWLNYSQLFGWHYGTQ